MMSYYDNKNNSLSEEFPRIHFNIYKDKVVLREEQNIVDSIRHYKRDFICITLLEKKKLCQATQNWFRYFSNFFSNFHSQKDELL